MMLTLAYHLDGRGGLPASFMVVMECDVVTPGNRNSIRTNWLELLDELIRFA